MIVYYDATERVDEYGKAKFYELVREHVSEVFEKSGLEINGQDQAIIDIYQKFAYSAVIAVKTNNPLLFEENFFEELVDPIGDWRVIPGGGDYEAHQMWSETVVPNTYGTDEQQGIARRAAVEMLVSQMRDQTGLAGLVQQLYPGRYLNHYGDDFKGLIVVCEYEGLL